MGFSIYYAGSVVYTINQKSYMDMNIDIFWTPQCLMQVDLIKYLLLSEVIGHHAEAFNNGILVRINQMYALS